jgi:hypothetical protein
MKLFSKCDGCKERKMLIYKRTYKIQQIGQKLTSEGELCRKCAKELAKMIKPHEPKS